jgi:hypothetical protein
VTTSAANPISKPTAPVRGTVISVSIPTTTSSPSQTSSQTTVQRPNLMTSQTAGLPSKPPTSSNINQSNEQLKQTGQAVTTSGGSELQSAKSKDGPSSQR